VQGGNRCVFDMLTNTLVQATADGHLKILIA
jgi:hypothetical protein